MQTLTTTLLNKITNEIISINNAIQLKRLADKLKLDLARNGEAIHLTNTGKSDKGILFASSTKLYTFATCKPGTVIQIDQRHFICKSITLDACGNMLAIQEIK